MIRSVSTLSSVGWMNKRQSSRSSLTALEVQSPFRFKAVLLAPNLERINSPSLKSRALSGLEFCRLQRFSGFHGVVFTGEEEICREFSCDSRVAAMGKSIRSKRLKRLRTLKRELVTPHYDAKEVAKHSVMEAALAAPKVVIPKKRLREEALEVEEPTRGRAGQTAMVVDEAGASTSSNNDSKLNARGGIKKRGKSQGRLKKERHHKKKLQF